jgi:hypothetical protein
MTADLPARIEIIGHSVVVPALITAAGDRLNGQ